MINVSYFGKNIRNMLRLHLYDNEEPPNWRCETTKTDAYSLQETPLVPN